MARHDHRFLASSSVWLCLAIGLCLTFILTIRVHQFEQEREDASFERHAQAAVNALADGISDATYALEVINQSFTTFSEVSRQQFHDFTLPLLERYPYIQAFGFHRIAMPSERAAFEGHGKLMPTQNKNRYRAADYIESNTGNEIALGLDASSHEYQDEALLRATDTGLPSSTSLTQFVQGDAASQGFLIVMPVYRQGVRLDSVEARRHAVIGYTVAVLRTQAFVERVIEPIHSLALPSFDYSVYADPITDEKRLALRKGPPPISKKTGLLSALWPFHDVPFTFYRPLNVAGTIWNMVVSPHKASFVQNHLASLFIGIVGVLLSVIGAGYLYNISLRAHRVERLVKERTAELDHSNKLLIDDIVARQKAEQALRASRATLRQLAAHQEGIREEERKRIAREIHDELGQNMLALRIDVSMLHARTATFPILNHRVSTMLQQIDETMKSVRSIINNLRPAVLDLGLPAAIEWQVKDFMRRSGIACRVRLEDPDLSLNDSHATALFRIVQESLTNVQRHAHADQVWITLQIKAQSLVLDISDNGIGFSADRGKTGSFGLLGMEERVKALEGAFLIGRSAQGGMQVTVTIPLTAANVPSEGEAMQSEQPLLCLHA